jgi:hypothetical protein
MFKVKVFFLPTYSYFVVLKYLNLKMNKKMSFNLFNVKLYTFLIYYLIMPSFLNNLKNKPLFLNLNFQRIMNSCEFKEIVVLNDFEFENGVLELDRDCYLSIVKFLDSSILRKV